ncbi:hypothetical protein ACOBR2_09390 [Telmatobacter bradus]|uniref:hypothetical protein n=1 Tax=Telmatobacter bradus TaxID=474953 RepID=UPI003B43A5E4
MELFKVWFRLSIAGALLGSACLASAAQLNNDARGAIPRDVQQLVVIDYKAMQNSQAAMQLRDRIMPPELRQFDEALRKSGLNDNHDVDSLAFALFRPAGSSSTDNLETVGIAQGQFSYEDIIANFHKQKLRATLLRTNKIYPMSKAGMVLCFIDPSTLVFGSKESVTAALDARDGVHQSLLTNNSMMDAMKSVDSEPLWSILDSKGTQVVLKQLMGEAGAVTDYDSVRKRMEACWYSMNFKHGVKFELTLETGDTIAAATVSSLLSAAVLVRKMSGSDEEKAALSNTTIKSNAGNLLIHFAADDTQFDNLLQSSLFKSVVR